MSKWKNVRTYLEVNPYTGQPVEEDMPTNAAGRGAVAGIGVGPDGEPGIDPKKRKKKCKDCKCDCHCKDDLHINNFDQELCNCEGCKH